MMITLLFVAAHAFQIELFPTSGQPIDFTNLGPDPSETLFGVITEIQNPCAATEVTMV